MSKQTETIKYEAWEELSAGRRLWSLFFIFAKIATFVVGGGYVILPMVEQELVDRRKWIKPEEFIDMMAIVQTIPGIIAGNCAIYIGNKLAGWRGAFFALAGVAIPPIIVILVIAIFFNKFASFILSNDYIKGAFIGVQAAVCGMVLSTAVNMVKKTFTGYFEWFVGLCSFCAVVFFPVNPGLAMVIAGVVGVIYLVVLTMVQARMGQKND